ncbi:hypothetical protein SynBIOSE41_02368 [Synechococcus sp. BIOS-E4-1]|nr:hypothetical protein SynBIOSE41_02368 [Synechococcus sp. BIOS-E4-1]
MQFRERVSGRSSDWSVRLELEFPYRCCKQLLECISAAVNCR